MNWLVISSVNFQRYNLFYIIGWYKSRHGFIQYNRSFQLAKGGGCFFHYMCAERCISLMCAPSIPQLNKTQNYAQCRPNIVSYFCLVLFQPWTEIYSIIPSMHPFSCVSCVVCLCTNKVIWSRSMFCSAKSCILKTVNIC